MADLRPMELGEILDGAFTLYKRHFGLFLRLGIVALWLPIALQVYIQLAGGPVQHLWVALFWYLAQYFAGLFLTAGVIRVISDTYLGREAKLGDALALGAAKIVPLCLVGLGKIILLVLVSAAIGLLVGVSTGLLHGAGILLGIVLACLGAWFFFFVLCGYGVTTQVVVLEELDGAFDSFGRSWELTRGLKGKVFGLYVVTFIITLVPAAAVGAVGGYFTLTNSGVSQVFTVFAALLPIALAPILPCVFTLMYYDLRVRREAFDLQLLGQQLGIV
jgi:hypothetical protein